MDFLISNPRALSLVLLTCGVLLIIVPKWIRLSIAVLMIALGLAGLFPQLLK